MKKVSAYFSPVEKEKTRTVWVIHLNKKKINNLFSKINDCRVYRHRCFFLFIAPPFVSLFRLDNDDVKQMLHLIEKHHVSNDLVISLINKHCWRSISSVTYSLFVKSVKIVNMKKISTTIFFSSYLMLFEKISWGNWTVPMIEEFRLNATSQIL